MMKIERNGESVEFFEEGDVLPCEDCGSEKPLFTCIICGSWVCENCIDHRTEDGAVCRSSYCLKQEAH